MRGTQTNVTHTKSTARPQSSRKIADPLANHNFFVTGSLCSFPRFSPPVFAIRKIFSQSDFPQIALSVAFRVQKGARLARSGRRRLVAPADASMIFSGGKTCRKLRALLPNMKDDRSSLSAGASSREWCVRQTRKKNTRCVRGRMRPGAPGARRDGAVRARPIPRAATSARF